MGKRGHSGDVMSCLGELANHRITKSAIAHVFETLHANGLLDERVHRRHIARAVAAHAAVRTPFGSVVQSLEVDINLAVDYICPAALLWYMCTISTSFADCCKSAVDRAGNDPLRYVAYNDGIVPGNPFRHEGGRKVEAWYWICVDWPTYLIHRSGMWPVFALIRHTLINDIPGGVSHISKLMLHKFKIFETGVLLPHPSGSFMMRCVFAGFVADLLAHKNILQSKGVPTGIRPCWNCANLTGRATRRPGEIGHLCHDPSQFTRFTDAHLIEMVERLHMEAATLASRLTATQYATAIAKLTTEVGFHVAPASILMDMELRSVYSPCDHHHRDWMHVIVCDGVGNWETGLILQCMKRCPAAIHVDMVQAFMMQCVLPKQRRGPHKEWLNVARLKASTVSSFASTMLSIMFIMQLFMDHFPDVAHHLPDHVRCYRLLCTIVWHLRVDDGIAERLPVLRLLIEDHHKLWAALYPTCAKPKLHQLHHVPDGIAFLGKVIACFTCERKHRSVKRSAVNVYRHFEHTTIVDMLNNMAEELGNCDIFAEQALVRCPRTVDVHGMCIDVAKSCLCHCGEIHDTDVIVFANSQVGRAVAFWKHPASITLAVQFILLTRVAPHVDVFHQSATVMFAPVSDVIDAVIWLPLHDGMIRVGMPPSGVCWSL